MGKNKSGGQKYKYLNYGRSELRKEKIPYHIFFNT